MQKSPRGVAGRLRFLLQGAGFGHIDLDCANRSYMLFIVDIPQSFPNVFYRVNGRQNLSAPIGLAFLPHFNKNLRM